MKSSGLRNTILLSLLCFFAALPVSVLACQWRVIPICDAFYDAEAVFIGTLMRTEPVEKTAISSVYAYFEVETTFKGVTKKQEKVWFMIGNCGRTFKPGERYFVYKEKEGTDLRLRYNRTALLSDSQTDQEYVKNLSSSDPYFSIGGSIDMVYGLPPGFKDLKELSIRVELENGKDTQSVMVDDSGIFEFRVNTDAGYRMRVIVPFDAELLNPGIVHRKPGQTILETPVETGQRRCFFKQFRLNWLK